MDVLFNKEVWRDPSPTRRNAHKWVSGITPTGGVIAQRTLPSVLGQFFDGYGTFPLHLEGFMVKPLGGLVGGPARSEVGAG